MCTKSTNSQPRIRCAARQVSTCDPLTDNVLTTNYALLRLELRNLLVPDLGPEEVRFVTMHAMLCKMTSASLPLASPRAAHRWPIAANKARAMQGRPA